MGHETAICLIFMMMATVDVDCKRHQMFVEVGKEDIMENQKVCVKNSKPTSKDRVPDCKCYGDHTTILSAYGGRLGCFSVKEVGCNYSVEGSDQAYLVNMDRHSR